MPKKTEKRVKGYGVFVKEFGGLIGFSNSIDMAEKLAKSEHREVSYFRSLDDFKVISCTITYTPPSQGKGKKKLK